jgi:hypothetical protein
MSTAPVQPTRRDAVLADDRLARPVETKPSYKTTELIFYVVAVLGVLIASVVVDGNGDGDNGSGGDYFRADRAWLYVVLLTIGYMISRGLAKSGSRSHSDR